MEKLSGKPLKNHKMKVKRLDSGRKLCDMTKEQIEELLEQLTLDEKIDMIHGNSLFGTKAVERLGIPEFMTSDGPMGIRMQYERRKWVPVGNSADYTSYLPSNTALAATWNRELARQTGQILGKETRGRGKDMILAPGINILRSPLCGRNFEYMGEDPYLTGEMAAMVVKGIEENDVSSCVKHFAVNNQEHRRLDVDVRLSERALQEIYLPAFKKAIQKGGAKAVMGAYNKFRGQHCCHNEYLLQKVLREDWGFTGVVVSDWGGVHDTMEAANNGLDMEMSVTTNYNEYYMADPLKEAVLKGEVEESVIDEKVLRILNLMNELHMLDGERKCGMFNDYADREQMLTAARQSVVLLKNEGILPIKPVKGLQVLVVGDNAERMHAPGGGSSEIKALYEITPLLGITMAAGGDVKVSFEPGYEPETSGNIWDNDRTESWQATSLNQDQIDLNDMVDYMSRERKEKNAVLAERAVAAAKEADVVIYVGGLNHDYDTEGKDRRTMKLPYEQEKLIGRLLEANKNTVMVMMAGSPVDMSSFQDQAGAIVYHWYCGMEGGRALGEVLFGKVNPSGRLPETLPIHEEDVPARVYGEFPGGDQVHYNEGIYVGYRYYETRKIPVSYPFGYGLSYTTYEFRNMQAVCDASGTLEISLDVANTGDMDGMETVQIYIGSEDSGVDRPVKELRGFTKVFVRAGETVHVTLTLGPESFTYFDEEKDCFVAEAGRYLVYAAKHVRDESVSARITLPDTIFLER